MAPSASTELVVPVSKVGFVKDSEVHVHGGEGKTPLEAISHGPLIHPGKRVLNYFSCNILRLVRDGHAGRQGRGVCHEVLK